MLELLKQSPILHCRERFKISSKYFSNQNIDSIFEDGRASSLINEKFIRNIFNFYEPIIQSCDGISDNQQYEFKNCAIGKNKFCLLPSSQLGKGRVINLNKHIEKCRKLQGFILTQNVSSVLFLYMYLPSNIVIEKKYSTISCNKLYQECNLPSNLDNVLLNKSFDSDNLYQVHYANNQVIFNSILNEQN